MPRTTLVLALLASLSASCKSAEVGHLSAPESVSHEAGHLDAEFPPESPEPVATAAADGQASVGGELVERRRARSLGTAYGEQRSSSVRQTPFERADASSPDLVLSLRYNDSHGVSEISRLKTGSAASQPAIRSSSAVSLTLRDDRGVPLPAAQVGADVYAIGEIGARYSIGVENHGGHRLEVVASVDGLDVLDGGEADLGKRGYIVEPYTSFAIDGWRTSADTVAAFRFSDTSGSYAARTGKPRNIGVIGVAFFRELGADREELLRRDSAEPFPSRYAPPPPGHRGHD